MLSAAVILVNLTFDTQMTTVKNSKYHNQTAEHMTENTHPQRTDG